MNATSQNDGIEGWVKWLAGEFETPGEVTERLQWIEKNCHLVCTAAMCPALPPCSAVQFDVVRINPEHESYRVGGGDDDDQDRQARRGDPGKGDRALNRIALMRLANAAGVSWDSDRSGRLDDASDPLYVHWRAVGGRRDLTGAPQIIDGDGKMDLREESAQWAKLRESVRPRRGDTAETLESRRYLRVRDARAKILELAQTAAKLRAIRDALAPRAYTLADLQIPFVVPRLVFTGRHANPEIERENIAGFRESFIAGGRALFGEARPRTLPISAPRLAPAPVANVSIGPIVDAEPRKATIDAEGKAVACVYCGALDGVEMVATRTGDVFVCDSADCYDKAQGEVSVQAGARSRSNPPPTTPKPPAAPANRTSYPSTAGGTRPTGASRPAAPTPRGPSPPDGAAGRERTNAPQSGHKAPFGPAQGTPIEELGPGQLRYFIRRLERTLEDGDKPQYRESDQALLDALKNELACRDGSVPY